MCAFSGKTCCSSSSLTRVFASSPPYPIVAAHCSLSAEVTCTRGLEEGDSVTKNTDSSVSRAEGWRGEGMTPEREQGKEGAL